MSRKRQSNDTPIYCLDSFSKKAGAVSFYIETLETHLREHAFVSKPHRHDFYMILYITKGGGEHTIDFVQYKVRPNSFFLMTPGQVHSWKLDPGTEGFIFFFIPEFYQMDRTEKHLQEFPFFHSLHSHPYIPLKKYAEPVIDVIIREMMREYQEPGDVNLHLLRSYLDVVLLKLVKYYDDDQTSTSLSTIYKLRKLEELIDQNYRTLKQPHHYAELMHLSSSYLNNLCKQSLGKTLSDLIQERIVLEAKRFFAYSDLTVSQVADNLNFSDPSYFIRFFRKQTGITPEQFREQIKSTV